jgi:hypothetical protein
MTGFDEQEMLALEEFLLKRCVPLISDENQNLALWGTGTFYRHGSSLCIVTAAHLFDEIALERLAVPTEPPTRPNTPIRNFVTLGSCGAHFPNPDERDLDVAVIWLHDAEFCARVSPSWEIVDRRNVTSDNPAMRSFLIAGYPRQTVARMHGIRREAFSQFYVDRLERPEETGVVGVDGFLTYGRSAFGLDGQQKQTPHLGGVSGASIWAVDRHPSGAWDASKVLKIVAVQSAFKHDAYIRTKSWALVSQVIERSQPM